MPGSGVRSLRARWLFPVSRPPIAGGIVTIAEGRIVAVGPRVGDGRVEDLGDVALLPGLVNAHTHLEFSLLERPLGEPGMSLSGWIARLVESFRVPPLDSLHAVQRGLDESLRLGTTTLAEIAQPGWPVEAFHARRPRALVFQELIAPTPARVEEKVELARRHVATGLPDRGLSPHAPYSVQPALLQAAVKLSAEHGVPLAMHLAESREELELLGSSTGPFRELLESWGQWDAGLVQPGSRPLDYLRAMAGSHRALVVHGNYLDAEEIAVLAENRERMSVVFCPRTHAFFGHEPYPLGQLLAAGARVALGTDSRASSPDLSVLAEMRLAAGFPSVSPQDVLRMATLDAAEALGVSSHAGRIEPGRPADLTAIGLPERSARDPHELLLESELPAVRAYLAGRP